MAEDEQTPTPAGEAKGKPARREAAAPAPPAEQPNSPEPVVERYGIAGWKERARTRFGESPHAVAGALHELGPEQELSEDEVRAKLDAFHSAEYDHGATA